MTEPDFDANTSPEVPQPPLVDVQFCYLETIGRITGQPHQIEMWYAVAPAGDRLFLMSGGRDRSDWVKNLRHDPRVRVRIDGVWYRGQAAVVEGGPDDLPARQALVAKYYGWRAGPLPNAWARESLPVAIRIGAAPHGTSEAG